MFTAHAQLHHVIHAASRDVPVATSRGHNRHKCSGNVAMYIELQIRLSDIDGGNEPIV